MGLPGSRWKRAPWLGHPESDQATSTVNYEFSGNTEKHVKLHCRDAVSKTPTTEMLQNNQLLQQINYEENKEKETEGESTD